MEQFIIPANYCRTKTGGQARCLRNNTQAFYNSEYTGGGNWRKAGTIENLICTFKNDVTPYSDNTLLNAMSRLKHILSSDLPNVLIQSGLPSLRVCVIPRSKRENYYRPNQLLLRATVQNVALSLDGFEDGTMDIFRHTDTATTHLARNGSGGAGEMPYVGITKETCTISDNIINRDILLIDDLYTKSVCIDEDCIQALYDKGAKSVTFYAIGKTVARY